MDPAAIIFVSIFALVIGRFVYGRVKYGSWTGAFAGGRIERTIGEVSTTGGMAGRQVLKMHAMRNDDKNEIFVALGVTSRTMLSASLQLYKLSKYDAQQLASFLNQAAK
jgi:hypothetical protein